MTTNRLRALQARGQSVWQDDLTRRQVASGELQRLIEDDGLSGVTSNPSTFAKAIGDSDDYDQDIANMARQGKDAAAVVDALVIADIQRAADVLRPVWDRTNGRDGFVSIEVAAKLARNTNATIAEVHRLWHAVNRPNIFVKIPGTVEGVPAIRQCLADGININITLLFSLAHYQAVARAYLEAVEERLRAGQSVERLASVASFFVSRIDTIVDQAINMKLEATDDPASRTRLDGLLGEVAIANAKLAYARFEEIFGSDGEYYQSLAARGAQVQRPLWASTSMKDPRRRDVQYVEELVAPQSVTTMPPATLNAFRDHGEVRSDTAQEDLVGARRTQRALQDVGISLDDLTAQLEEQGIKQFADAYEDLLGKTAAKIEQVRRAA